MAKKALPLLLLCQLVVLLVSCGGGGSGTLARVKKDKRAYIGVVPFEQPLLYQEAQEMVGPEAEISNRIAEKLGGKVGLSGQVVPHWINRSYKSLAAALANEEVDLVVSVFGITRERETQLRFSTPYYTSELVLVINPLHKKDLRPNDLEGQKIGVREGTAAAEKVKVKSSKSTVTPFGTLDDAILALKRREIDAVIDDRLLAAYSLATTPGVTHLEIVPGVIDTVQCAVAVRKNDKELLSLINEVIAEVKEQNLYPTWTAEHIGDRLAQVEQRHQARLERAKKAAEPRRVVIRVSKDRRNNFDIYRFANLSFVLTNRSSGKTYTASRIDFKGPVGVSAVNVPPGNYSVVLPKFNFRPGTILVLESDPNRISVNIRLQADNRAKITRS
ncbi:MAG: substrate-binding periplasmic protein [Acidobacteriota bacterium]